MTQDDEGGLVDGLTVGDPDATSLFVGLFQPRVRRAVQAAGIPPSDSEDLTQEILIEALRQLHAGRFEGRSSLGHWLRRITAGRIVDYRRASSRRGRDKETSLEVTDTSAAAFMTLAAQESLLLVEEVLALMPPRHRMAMVEHCRSGVPVEALAALFGLSVKRTRTIITEAKELFRQLIRDGEKTASPRRLKE